LITLPGHRHPLLDGRSLVEQDYILTGEVIRRIIRQIIERGV
jgi:hypothetical protein